MHKEILTEEQLALLPLVKEFSKDSFLVGGTAIALHLGHRQSIDFDLFTQSELSINKIRTKIFRHGKINHTHVNEEGEYTVSVQGVKFTFLTYPYPIEASVRFEKTARLPDLLTLSAMKAYAISRRAKWKDYVDLYFIIKDHYSVERISKKAKEIFAGEFNEKIFRESLAYFKDIDYSEEVIFRPGFKVSEKTVEKKLVEFSLS
jgi:hypothetical protein